MPTLKNWTDPAEYANQQGLTCRTSDHGPVDEANVPESNKAIRFGKITDNQGKQFLDIAVNVLGRPAHYVLDRDDIERLKAFLGCGDNR